MDPSMIYMFMPEKAPILWEKIPKTRRRVLDKVASFLEEQQSQGLLRDLSLEELAAHLRLKRTDWKTGQSDTKLIIWVLFLFMKQHARVEWPFPTLADFWDSYPEYRSPLESQEENFSLFRYANWVRVAIEELGGKNNKTTILKICARLAEGPFAVYVTGSGQSRFTDRRVRLIDGLENFDRSRSFKATTRQHNQNQRPQHQQPQQQQPQPQPQPMFTCPPPSLRDLANNQSAYVSVSPSSPPSSSQPSYVSSSSQPSFTLASYHYPSDEEEEGEEETKVNLKEKRSRREPMSLASLTVPTVERAQGGSGSYLQNLRTFQECREQHQEEEEEEDFFPDTVSYPFDATTCYEDTLGRSQKKQRYEAEAEDEDEAYHITSSLPCGRPNLLKPGSCDMGTHSPEFGDPYSTSCFYLSNTSAPQIHSDMNGLPWLAMDSNDHHNHSISNSRHYPHQSTQDTSSTSLFPEQNVDEDSLNWERYQERGDLSSQYFVEQDPFDLSKFRSEGGHAMRDEDDDDYEDEYEDDGEESYHFNQQDQEWPLEPLPQLGEARFNDSFTN